MTRNVVLALLVLTFLFSSICRNSFTAETVEGPEKVGIPEPPPFRSWSFAGDETATKARYKTADISFEREDGTVLKFPFRELAFEDQDAVLKFLKREIDRSKAVEWLGTITEVTDGDTVIFHDRDENRHIIRLNDIDAPESSQEFGLQSTKHLEKLVLGKTVRLRWFERDRYGRILGDILPGESGEDSANVAMVSEGLAWWYEAYSDSAAIRKRESEAREAKRGIWASKDPQPPWLFRRNTARPIFYVAKNGDEYHGSECEKVDAKSIPISRELAELNEFSPCRECIGNGEEE